ncbi:GNAT family N-acetyltransferase [Sinosporangium siamense]|uniref:Ribosomal-protein-alanine acetyltransferase n=1 Tax=Sinosporangium siamense TaxID=1367973 RepID=A0A919RBW8_9ACTN|nr:GNAT family protein [Sinosporangium siamense]GII90612.1 ribosomal-protein-alanine acetyltransferase [Sinosporangium siamense]
MPVTRLATVDDAPAVTSLLRANREAFAPWEPLRDEDWFSLERQRAVLEGALTAHAQGTTVPLVILDGDKVAGRLNLNGITRGALQSAAIGYWVGVAHQGRGLATAAVADTIALAFGELDLHRLQAETLLHNTASQQVLLHNGFRPYGIAPSYLRIAGSWQDHILFHLLAKD